MVATDEHQEASTEQHVAPVDYTQHFGQEGHARQLASLRVLLSAFTGVPGIIGLHGGLPPADAFPFTEMSFTLRDGTKLQITDPAQVMTEHINAHALHLSLPLLQSGDHTVSSLADTSLCTGCCCTAVQCHPARLSCVV